MDENGEVCMGERGLTFLILLRSALQERIIKTH